MNILVTGCSRGVGFKICRVLLEQGHTVYGVARNYTDDFKELAMRYKDRLFFKSVDLSAPAEIHRQVFKEYVTNRIALDGVVNNAAMAYDDIVTNLRLEKLEAMYAVNVFAPMMITKYAIRNMLFHRTKGCIVHINDLQCTLPVKERWKLSLRILPGNGESWESVPMLLFPVLWKRR